jgi:hypothetical protein
MERNLLEVINQLNPENKPFTLFSVLVHANDDNELKSWKQQFDFLLYNYYVKVVNENMICNSYQLTKTA